MEDSSPRGNGSAQPEERAPGVTGPGDGDPGFGRQTTPWNTLTARVVALVSRKGGVGKTTSAINLGAALALSGHTVLVVGIDPQCGVSRTLGAAPESLDGRLLDVFGDHRPLAHVAQTSPLKNLFFVSPGIRSLEEEERFVAAMTEEVDTFVAEIDRARNLYDTIVIDCPPSLGPLTRAALLASDSYLVPVQAEELCRDSLEPLIEFIDSFRNSIDLEEERARTAGGPAPRPLALEGLFLTMANARTRMGRHVAERVQQDHSSDLLGAVIPRAVRLSEMALRGKPAVIYDRRSASSRAYFDLADELVARYCRRNGAEVPQPIFAGAELPETLESPDREGGTLAGPRRGGDEREATPHRTSYERLLADLRARLGSSESLANGDESASPEMVSLDDLLAEEERRSPRSERDWDDDYWAEEDRFGGRRH
jgi:chromosome partitioning protein